MSGLAAGGVVAPELLRRPELVPADGEVVLVADWRARRDGFGRCQFSAWWWVDYLPGVDGPAVRGQVFVGSPEEHAAGWEAHGRSVRVEDEGGGS